MIFNQRKLNIYNSRDKYTRVNKHHNKKKKKQLINLCLNYPYIQPHFKITLKFMTSIFQWEIFHHEKYIHTRVNSGT